MKHSIIPILAAAAAGISAVTVPVLLPEAPAGIVAEAANEQTYTYGSFQYSYVPGSSEATLTGYTGSDTAVTISAYVPAPDGIWKTVTKIGDRAFSPVYPHESNNSPKNITSVSIPSTVTSIGEQAFKMTPLTSLNLPSSVLTVGEEAFHGCEALRQVVVSGPAMMGDRVFMGCTDLRSVRLHQDCHAGLEAFSHTKVMLLNGRIPWNKTAYAGGAAPAPETANHIYENLRNCFSTSVDMYFLDEYAAAMCSYVVQTETRSWMSDLVKARQLHDWLIRHCDYEDQLNGEHLMNSDNHDGKNVFFSSALDIRGAGVGETVCEGYSEAYTALLAEAGIESYKVSGTVSYPGGGGGHAWNIVKIGSTYYQCDVTFDESIAHGTSFELNPVQTVYDGFMKSDADLVAAYLSRGAVLQRYSNGNQSPGAAAALQNCSAVSMQDYDCDGILDYDFDFDGYAGTWIDNYVVSRIAVCDLNIDGQVNVVDAALYQYYCSMFGGAYFTPGNWLRFAVAANLFGA